VKQDDQGDSFGPILVRLVKISINLFSSLLRFQDDQGDSFGPGKKSNNN
jgi:hypothetical protein